MEIYDLSGFSKYLLKEKENNSICEYETLMRGDRYDKHLSAPTIIYLGEGTLQISYDKVENLRIKKGMLLLVPPISHLSLLAEEDSQVLLLHMNKALPFSENFSPEDLYTDEFMQIEDGYTLPTEERIRTMIEGVIDIISRKIYSAYFFEIKLRELLFYLSISYPKEELAKFFSPIMSKNANFAFFVFNNYMKVRNVRDLAGLYGYSQAGFEKLFKKNFGMSAYKWMREQKAGHVYSDLVRTDKAFKEISDEYGFHSLSQFNNFCKREFGMTPGEIRKLKSAQV